MTIGIYKLNFNGTTKCYIGKSNNIEYRYKGHIRSFLRGEASEKMMGAYTLYGLPDIEIIIHCSSALLEYNENICIIQYNAVNNGFNTHNTSTGFSRSTSGENNHKSKYSDAQIIECMDILLEHPDMLYSEIESIISIPRGSISMIAHGGNHRWLQEYDPIKYTKLMSMVGLRRGSCKSALKQGINYPEIVSPEGTVYIVNNSREFARVHELDQAALGRVLNSKAKTHKGWKLKEYLWQ